MSNIYVNWGESRVKLTWQNSKQLPERSLITSVHGFCFLDHQLLLVDLKHRGWDFPGGHIDLDETPEECLNREVLEEGSVEGNCELLGFIIVDNSEDPLWNENSPYPKVGYQVFYKMKITQLHPFKAEHESTQRIFINPKNVSSYCQNWNQLYQEILNGALLI
ncbi:NUDIX hydrolase [Hazenella coriacea]|uniref:NUDIX domain-containing protein n=1 Tax=Hazenella coriacea TaxID=1179467 RepID=A0A4R3L7I2_9BACL|nr:NUDIX domain-containing protein [Hazenella coriacea]TCS93446.1 NUDIX domain-containing protein [Hazenella coriacea]